MELVVKHALAWTVLLAFAAACDSAERPAPPSEPTSLAVMHHLDFGKPMATMPVTQANAAQAKFVQVRVAHVENPARVALSFGVAYRSNRGEEIALGSFSLYPSDNPGTFIVPTQGKVRTGGSIVVRLESPDKDPRVAVTIGEIKLILDPT